MGFPAAMTVHRGWTVAVSRGLAECEVEGEEKAGRETANLKDTLFIPADFFF